jgi:hypothetical protein
MNNSVSRTALVFLVSFLIMMKSIFHVIFMPTSCSNHMFTEYRLENVMYCTYTGEPAHVWYQGRTGRN